MIWNFWFETLGQTIDLMQVSKMTNLKYIFFELSKIGWNGLVWNKIRANSNGVLSQPPIHFRFFQVSDVTQWYSPFVAISSEEWTIFARTSEGYARTTFSAERRKLAISRKEARVWRYKPKSRDEIDQNCLPLVLWGRSEAPRSQDHPSKLNLVLSRNFEAYFEIDFYLRII